MRAGTSVATLALLSGTLLNRAHSQTYPEECAHKIRIETSATTYMCSWDVQELAFYDANGYKLPTSNPESSNYNGHVPANAFDTPILCGAGGGVAGKMMPRVTVHVALGGSRPPSLAGLSLALW